MKLKLIILALFLIILSACSSNDELSDEEKLQLSVLYSHSIQMAELSTPQQLKDIGLNPQGLEWEDNLSVDEQISRLEKAYGINLEGKSNAKKIQILEDKMVEMMANWDYN